MKFVKVFLIVFAIIIFVTLLSYLLAPDLSVSLSEEGGFIENISAFLFIVSSFTGLFFYFKEYRSIFIIISVISLIGFLDEISFGANLLGFKVPIVYGQYIDAVHDIFYLITILIYKLTSAYPYLLMPVILAGTILLFYIIIKYRNKIIQLLKRLDIYNRPFILLISFFTVLIFLSLIIDLDRVHNDLLFLLEEVFEMGAAMALFFCNFSMKEIFFNKYLAVNKI